MKVEKRGGDRNSGRDLKETRYKRVSSGLRLQQWVMDFLKDRELKTEEKKNVFIEQLLIKNFEGEIREFLKEYPEGNLIDSEVLDGQMRLKVN